MNTPTAYHQLGRFIVDFQHLEDTVNNLLGLLANTDDSVVQILANDLEYGKRRNTADVLFAYFVDLRNNTKEEAKAEFHRLMVELREFGERRNELVHSRYNPWRDIQNGRPDAQKTKLRGSKGEREQKEEELQPSEFDRDLQRLAVAAAALERFRLQIIDG